jgi:hypothetical protein
MAIIDNLQKISDMVWELPSSYKAGMQVPAWITHSRWRLFFRFGELLGISALRSCRTGALIEP